MENRSVSAWAAALCVFALLAGAFVYGFSERKSIETLTINHDTEVSSSISDKESSIIDESSSQKDTSSTESEIDPLVVIPDISSSKDIAESMSSDTVDNSVSEYTLPENIIPQTSDSSSVQTETLDEPALPEQMIPIIAGENDGELDEIDRNISSDSVTQTEDTSKAENDDDVSQMSDDVIALPIISVE